MKIIITGERPGEFNLPPAKRAELDKAVLPEPMPAPVKAEPVVTPEPPKAATPAPELVAEPAKPVEPTPVPVAPVAPAAEPNVEPKAEPAA